MDSMMTTAADRPIPNHTDVYHDDPFIELQSGVWHLNDPYYEVSDIAHNLAQINRYNGACNFPYNVGEHSVLVSLLMQHEVGGDPFEGLMHDASEAYINDLSSPVKGELPDYRALEHRIGGEIRAEFGLGPTKSNECRRADQLALFIESNQLMPSKGSHYRDPNGLRPLAAKLRDKGWRIHGFDWVRSQQIWTQRYNELRGPRVTLTAKSR